MKTTRTLPIILAVVAAAACNDTNGPGNGAPQATLSFVVPSAPAASMSALADETFVDGQNTLIITKAEVVLREIELKRIDVSCEEALNEDDCEKFETGPMLVDLPLDGQVEQTMAIEIDAGTYREVEFEIHKVTSDEEDAAFRATHPDLEGISIRVQGTFNGDAFTYTSDLDVEQEFDLSPPIVVDENTTTINVTVLLDLNEWFRDASGALVDPTSGNKGAANEGLIKENIKQSIEAFEDDDRDGDDDHDDS